MAKINLRYDLIGAGNAHERRSAFEVLQSLGITAERCVPQTLADQIWFINCTNVPAELPKFITRMKDGDGHNL